MLLFSGAGIQQSLHHEAPFFIETFNALLHFVSFLDPMLSFSFMVLLQFFSFLDPMLSFPVMVLFVLDPMCFTDHHVTQGLVEELDGLFVVVHDPCQFLHSVSEFCHFTRFNAKHLEGAFVLKTQWLQVLETEDNGLAVLLEWDLLVLEEP